MGNKPLGMATPTVEELEAENELWKAENQSLRLSQEDTALKCLHQEKEIERLQKLYDVAVADRVRMHEEIEYRREQVKRKDDYIAELEALIEGRSF